MSRPLTKLAFKFLSIGDLDCAAFARRFAAAQTPPTGAYQDERGSVLSIMAEVAIENRVYRYEAKPQPTAHEPGKIVEAFGLGKCPKLAEQV